MRSNIFSARFGAALAARSSNRCCCAAISSFVTNPSWLESSSLNSRSICAGTSVRFWLAAKKLPRAWALGETDVAEESGPATAALAANEAARHRPPTITLLMTITSKTDITEHAVGRGSSRSNATAVSLSLLARAMLPPKRVRLLPFFRSDLAVVVEIGLVEMRQRRSLRLCQRDSTVVVGVGHLEQMPGEAHAPMHPHSAVHRAPLFKAEFHLVAINRRHWRLTGSSGCIAPHNHHALSAELGLGGHELIAADHSIVV